MHQLSSMLTPANWGQEPPPQKHWGLLVDGLPQIQVCWAAAAAVVHHLQHHLQVSKAATRTYLDLTASADGSDMCLHWCGGMMQARDGAASLAAAWQHSCVTAASAFLPKCNPATTRLLCTARALRCISAGRLDAAPAGALLPAVCAELDAGKAGLQRHQHGRMGMP